MRHIIAAAAILTLAACAEPIEERDETEADMAQLPTAAELSAQRPTLVPGVIDEALRRDRNLISDLGCVFRRGNETLFAAAANSVSLEGADGLVVLDGQPQEIQMDGSGGYNSLQAAASFTGDDGLTVEIEVSEAAEIQETPAPLTGPAPMEATMTIARGEQSVAIDGRYECGPQPEA